MVYMTANKIEGNLRKHRFFMSFHWHLFFVVFLVVKKQFTLWLKYKNFLRKWIPSDKGHLCLWKDVIHWTKSATRVWWWWKFPPGHFCQFNLLMHMHPSFSFHHFQFFMSFYFRGITSHHLVVSPPGRQLSKICSLQISRLNTFYYFDIFISNSQLFFVYLSVVWTDIAIVWQSH